MHPSIHPRIRALCSYLSWFDAHINAHRSLTKHPLSYPYLYNVDRLGWGVPGAAAACCASEWAAAAGYLWVRPFLYFSPYF